MSFNLIFILHPQLYSTFMDLDIKGSSFTTTAFLKLKPRPSQNPVSVFSLSVSIPFSSFCQLTLLVSDLRDTLRKVPNPCLTTKTQGLLGWK